MEVSNRMTPAASSSAFDAQIFLGSNPVIGEESNIHTVALCFSNLTMTWLEAEGTALGKDLQRPQWASFRSCFNPRLHVCIHSSVPFINRIFSHKEVRHFWHHVKSSTGLSPIQFKYVVTIYVTCLSDVTGNELNQIKVDAMLFVSQTWNKEHIHKCTQTPYFMVHTHLNTQTCAHAPLTYYGTHSHML